MRRSLWISLLGIIGVAVVMFGAVLASGDHPLLGLDLRGGVSVVLQPNRKVPGSSLNKAVDIIRSRVDALGVAEPDITRQGNRIVVQLPQIKDPERARQIVGQTAQLFIRPVAQALPPATPSTTRAARLRNRRSLATPMLSRQSSPTRPRCKRSSAIRPRCKRSSPMLPRCKRSSAIKRRCKRSSKVKSTSSKYRRPISCR